VVVEHARLDEQRLRERERTARVARQKDALREFRGGTKVNRLWMVCSLGGRHGPRL
jgi:hypothetical protein